MFRTMVEGDSWMNLCNRAREQPEDWSRSEGPGRENAKNRIGSVWMYWKESWVIRGESEDKVVRIPKKLSKPGLPWVQWLRIHLPTQGTWVWALVQEDPTCHGATKPMCYNYWACALEPASHSYWAHAPQLLKPTCLELVLCNKRSHHNEKPVHRNEE